MDRCTGPRARQALAITQHHEISDLLGRVLAARDVTIHEVSQFLTPRLRDHFPDPMHLRDMSAAVERTLRAIQHSESLFIVGDYDVDGACASALLAIFFKECHVRFSVHIPDRLTEGYGPSAIALAAARQAEAHVFITVDCGTLSHEIIGMARQQGLDVIILDHHQASEVLPDAFVINPNRQDELSPLGNLCATGVVFCFLVALRRRLITEGFWTEKEAPQLLENLDLVALATVADVVPLSGLNRAFVSQGLVLMKQRARTGLAALMDVGGVKNPPEVWHLGFVLVPRLNASGRIGDSSLAMRLLTTQNPEEAQNLAHRLDHYNRERQTLETLAVEHARAQAEKRRATNPNLPLLVVHNPTWHPGILGLIAARLKEHFDCPCFALAASDANPSGWVGSGRSIPGVDLGFLVRQAVSSGFLLKGGGHAMAAGITVAPTLEALEAFTHFAHTTLTEILGSSPLERTLGIDGVLSARSVTVERVEELLRAGPYGAGNPEPIFALPSHRVTRVSVIKESHIRLRLEDGEGYGINAMAFRTCGTPLGERLCSALHTPLHVAGSLSLDAFRGVKTPLLRIIDCAS